MLVKDIIVEYTTPVVGSTVSKHDKQRLDDDYNLSKKGSKAQQIKKEVSGKSVSHLKRAAKRAHKNADNEKIHATERYQYKKLADLMDQLIHLRN